MVHKSTFALASGFVALACSSSTPAGGSDAGARDANGDTFVQLDGSQPERDANKDGDNEDAQVQSCTQADGASFGNDVCNKCMDSRCCPAVDACFLDQDCSDLADCITACLSGDGGADAGGPTC